MSNQEYDRSSGFAFLCDHSGAIKEIINDELSIFQSESYNGYFFDIIDNENEDKGENFLKEIIGKNAAFSWEINTRVKGEIRSIHYSGCLREEDILVVGSDSFDNLISYMEELMKLNNQQVNALRQELKKRYDERKFSDSKAYDELSKLNNELSNAKRKIEKKNAELERLNEMKNQFIGMAAHDLRNPLSVIISLCDLMLNDAERDDESLSEEHLEFIEQIKQSSDFMLQLVEDLLDVSQIESGKLSLEREKTNFAELVEKNISLNRQVANEKNIELSVEISPEIPEIHVDPRKMEQVLNNLISNAIKYSQEGSKVKIALERKDETILLTVADNGPGIPEKEQEKLFEPFEKTSVQATGDEKSTGLGLTITKKIVEGHGGAIWVESEEGEGSTFYVSIPYDEKNEHRGS